MNLRCLDELAVVDLLDCCFEYFLFAMMIVGFLIGSVGFIDKCLRCVKSKIFIAVVAFVIGFSYVYSFTNDLGNFYCLFLFD